MKASSAAGLNPGGSIILQWASYTATAVTIDSCRMDLYLVAFEELVLLAGAAVTALQAGYEQHSYPHRDQHGKNTAIRRDPMHQMLHGKLNTPSI